MNHTSCATWIQGITHLKGAEDKDAWIAQESELKRRLQADNPSLRGELEQVRVLHQHPNSNSLLVQIIFSSKPLCEQLIKSGRILLDGLTHMRSSSLTQEKKCVIAQNAKTRDIFIIFVSLLPHSVRNASRLMLIPSVPHYLNISNVQTVCKITKFALALVLLWPKPWLIILPTFPPSNQLTACQSIITIIAKRLTHPLQALNPCKSNCNTPDQLKTTYHK